MFAPKLQPRLLPLQHAHQSRALTPNQMDAMPSQREGQLDDEADYQTAYQSARTDAVNGGRGGPIASLRAGPQHRPTVDGMEEVSVGSFELVGGLPRPGVIWNCRGGL